MNPADPAHARNAARLGDLFSRVVDLPPAERERELAALDPDEAAALRRLLDLEATGTDPLGDAIAAVGAAGSRPLAQDARLGPWRILDEIGAGGMGTVFLAERADGQYTQRAAIKLIRGFPTEDGRRRLRLERQILAGLDHPHIARLLDGGETADGQPWIAMEYVDGEGLIEAIARRRLGLAERLALFDRIAEAVAHAHQRLVVHRDLKPRNVLVRADGTPKLLDFGIAQLIDVGLEGGSDETSTRAWTPGYASPEQRAGLAITTATDVYGLGVMLREMLTGSRAGDDARAPPDGFPVIAPDADLRGLIAMATAEDPAARYPSVEALRDDLGRYLTRRPLRARADTVAYRALKFVARHRLGVAAALAVAIAGASFVWRLDVERQRALAAETEAAARGEAARRAADAARRALDFVVGVFSEAHPERTLGRAMTPRMLVDEARQRLDADATLAPAMRRTLALTLGEIYHGLGEARIALDLYRQALEGPEPETADEIHERVRTLEGIAIAWLSLGSGREAADASTAAAELLEGRLPDDPRARLRARALRVYAADQAGDSDFVLRNAPAILADADASSDFAIADRIGVLLRLTEAQKRAGRLDEALGTSSRMLALLDAHYPPLDPMRIRLRRTHAGVLGALGRYAEAESTLRAAIANYRQVAGGDGQQVAMLLNDLSMLLNDAGRPAEALATLEESRAIRARVAGDALAEDPISLQNLGSLQESVGEYVAAVATLSEAVRLIRAQFPEGSPSVLKAEANLARALAFAGRHAESQALFERVRAAHAAGGDSSRFDWAIETFRQAGAARLAGRLDQAAALLAEAEAVLGPMIPKDHPLMAQIHRQRGMIAAARGDFGAARADLTRARGIVAGAELPALDLALIDVSLAEVAMRTGDPGGARARLAGALPVLRDTVGPREYYRARAEALAKEIGVP
jgi:serine/threonine-protein kinase